MHPVCKSLFELALTSSFRLFLTLYGRLFIMLSFTNLLNNAVS